MAPICGSFGSARSANEYLFDPVEGCSKLWQPSLESYDSQRGYFRLHVLQHPTAAKAKVQLVVEEPWQSWSGFGVLGAEDLEKASL